MDKPQGGMGATAERMARGNITTRRTMRAGEVAQCERWTDIGAFMIDQGMIDGEAAYGWADYCRLETGDRGTGQGGEGWKQQEWVEFGKIVGPARLKWLSELADYPIPSSDPQDVQFTRWRLTQCLGRIRDTLVAARSAAQEARKRVEAMPGYPKR